MEQPQPGPFPPFPPYRSRAPDILGVNITFLLLALGFYVARMYTRIRVLKCAWWDDWIISAGMVFGLTGGILQIILPVRYGFGLHFWDVSFEKAIGASKVGFVIQLFSVTNITLTKISTAVMIFRIKKSSPWTFGLSSLIALVVVTWIFFLVSMFIQCTPLAANWNPLIPGAHCSLLRVHSFYICSALFMTSDLIYACLPMFFLRDVRRPLREKIVLVILMGFGLFATAACAIKLIYVINFRDLRDGVWDGVPVAIWAKTEEYVAVIAACLPPLKSSFERVLKRFGLLPTQVESEGYYFSHNSHSTKGSKGKSALSRDPELVFQEGSETELVVMPDMNGGTRIDTTSHTNPSETTTRTYEEDRSISSQR